MPLALIERCVTVWLEEAYCAPGITEARLEKRQHKIETWIEEHEEIQETSYS